MPLQFLLLIKTAASLLGTFSWLPASTICPTAGCDAEIENFDPSIQLSWVGATASDWPNISQAASMRPKFGTTKRKTASLSSQGDGYIGSCAFAVRKFTKAWLTRAAQEVARESLRPIAPCHCIQWLKCRYSWKLNGRETNSKENSTALVTRLRLFGPDQNW